MEGESIKVLDYLRKLCSLREYCRSDIAGKAGERLKGVGGTENIDGIVGEIVKILEEEGYLSDERYAGAFARDKAGIAGWGPLKIRQALRQKGVSEENVKMALSSIDGAKNSEKLRKSLEVKYKLLGADPQAKLKLLKFALSRGYEYPQAAEAVDEIMKIKNNHEEI